MTSKPTVFNYQDYEKAAAENKRLRDRIANMEIRYRIIVRDTLEQVKAEICDEYCKYPEEYADDPEDVLLAVCDDCPLGRL